MKVNLTFTKPRTESFPESLCNIAVENICSKDSTSWLQKVHKGECLCYNLDTGDPHLWWTDRFILQACGGFRWDSRFANHRITDFCFANHKHISISQITDFYFANHEHISISQLTEFHFVLIWLPPMKHHSFFRNLLLLFIQ